MDFDFNVYKNELTIPRDKTNDQNFFEHSGIIYSKPMGLLGKIFGFAKEITLTTGLGTRPVWVNKKKFNKFLKMQEKAIPTYLEKVIAKGIKNIKEEVGQEKLDPLIEKGKLESLKKDLEETYQPVFEKYAETNKNVTAKQLMKITAAAWLSFQEGEFRFVRLGGLGSPKVLVGKQKGGRIEIFKYVKPIAKGAYGKTKLYEAIIDGKKKLIKFAREKPPDGTREMALENMKTEGDLHEKIQGERRGISDKPDVIKITTDKGKIIQQAFLGTEYDGDGSLLMHDSDFTGEKVIDALHQVFSGLVHLKQENVVHVNTEPSALLVRKTGEGKDSKYAVHIGNLGEAKQLNEKMPYEDFQKMYFIERYTHPDDFKEAKNVSHWIDSEKKDKISDESWVKDFEMFEELKVLKDLEQRLKGLESLKESNRTQLNRLEELRKIEGSENFKKFKEMEETQRSDRLKELEVLAGLETLTAEQSNRFNHLTALASVGDLGALDTKVDSEVVLLREKAEKTRKRQMMDLLEKASVYSTCASFYEIITGAAYDPEDESSFRLEALTAKDIEALKAKGIPPKVILLLTEGLDKNYRKRPSPNEFKQKLERLYRS
jgi:serine/threonine protein kinase